MSKPTPVPDGNPDGNPEDLDEVFEDHTPPASIGDGSESEGPKFNFDDVLGDDAGITRLTKKVLKKIEKEGWEQVDFSDRADKPVFDFTFPAFFDKEDDFLKNFSHLYYDGESAYLFLAGHNDLNRPVTIAPVIDHAAEMLTGRWREYTHQGVAVTRPRTPESDPELQDGQHRLLSVYLASKINPDIKIRLVTAFNMDPKNSDKIDGNTVRGTKDKLVMLLKKDGYAFNNDSYLGVKDRDIVSVVKAMPGHSGITEDRALAFAKENLSVIVEFLVVLQGTRAIRYKANWAAPFIKAGILFGRDVIFPLAQRFARNQWDYYDEDNRMDALQSFHERMVRDATAGPSQKVRGDAIKAMAMYAIRKSLLGESVSGQRGSRYMAEHIRFSEEEVADHKQFGDKSKVLKIRSKARQKRTDASY